MVPPQGRKVILKDLHNDHPGMVRMKVLTRSYVWWPEIDEDIENMEKNVPHVSNNTEDLTEDAFEALDMTRLTLKERTRRLFWAIPRP
ncbi:unnamed protein product [Schistocephalus solidus]|uniref:Integrase_H2C2 domain-containing protein n=1 Tax=Schistocephalus solidus TaxID=70667 RepID=A0A183SGS8_SCHSO|nr:unnamed protein product [Schistocephalus solidus]